MEVLDDYLGQAVGKLYVERYFPAEAKAQMATMESLEFIQIAKQIVYTDFTDEIGEGTMVVLPDAGVGTDDDADWYADDDADPRDRDDRH